MQFHHPHSRKITTPTTTKFLIFLNGISCISLFAHCLTSCHWLPLGRFCLGCLYSSYHPSGIFTHISQSPLWTFSRLNKPSSQPLLTWQMLKSFCPLWVRYVCTGSLEFTVLSPLSTVEAKDHFLDLLVTLNAAEDAVGLCRLVVNLVSCMTPMPFSAKLVIIAAKAALTVRVGCSWHFPLCPV